MRTAVMGVVLTAAVSSFGGVLSGVATPQRDAAAILREMRQALGGAAALEGLQSLSMAAEGRLTVKGVSIELADDYFLLLPDRYLRVRRLMHRLPEPVRSRLDDARMFEGFRDAELIRLVGGHKTPQSDASEGDRLALAKFRHDAARLLLALTGRTMPGYPLALAAGPAVDVGGTTYDVIEASTADGVVMRLFVDSGTHLPAMVATTGLEKTPETRWFVSDFKRAYGVNWPRQIEEQVDGGPAETLSIKAWRLNPRLDARTFEPVIR